MKRARPIILLIPFLFLFLKCSPQKKDALLKAGEFKKGKRLAELKEKKLVEVSGLASSVNNPGMMWTVNDSGNDPEVFLIDLETNIKQKYTLEGIENRDWEDVAVGPGPDPTKSYVYVAEIGDNMAIHGYKHIYRFEEPVVGAAKEKDIAITKFETITFSLADSKRDTEALLIDRKTKDLYIISKWSDPVYIYRIPYPYSTSDTTVAAQIGSLAYSKIVAGDISKDGRDILLKNYSHIYLWHRDGTKSIVETLQSKPQEIPYETEPQGESITWAQDNSGFYTLSEIKKGQKTYLYFYERKEE
ncbi:MAG: hypothetical protein ABIS36_14820 [Chryseolinea sp.]